MSQFRVQKVTKVKGPSELSTSKSSESSTKKARANLSTTDRPQAQPRLKKTSTPPKLADGKNTQSSSDKASSNTSSSQRSTTRNRPTAAKRTTTKTCTSQQSRRNGSPQTATKQSRNKADIDSTKTAAPVKPSIPQRPTRQETTAKKSPPQIEKENSYDASGSDSDEPHLFGKLSPKDDVGYETGSFDEIDGSNSETTSPAAGEENKTILNQNRKDDITEYSYDEVEFRPLIVFEGGGVSAPVPTAHQDKLQNTQPPRDVDNPIERLSYAYAGEEFRPLIITDSGGIVAPLEGRKSTDQANSSPLVDQRRAPMRYEEVEVLGGKFDRANVDTSQLWTAMPTGSSNYGIPVEIEDDMYEMVNQQNTSRTEQFPNARQQNFTSTNEEQDSGDIYAVVQKDKTKKEANISHKLSGASSLLSSEIPPETPPRFDITKSDLCESISGELQDMINSYSDDKIGKTSRSSSREGYSSSDSGKVAVRPTLPKPYSGSGIRVVAKENAEIEAASSDEDYEASPLYAAVQKKPKKKTPPKKSEPQLKEQSGEPPPLPSRTNLEEKDDTLGRDISLSQTEKELPEKSKKSGFGIFKKKHQRKMSDGNVISHTGEAFWYLSPGASNKGHKRSKSQDDMTKVINNLLGDSGKSDSGNLIEPYLAVDIIDPPNTPRELQKLNSYWEDKENEYDNDELPEGWKEVESENGTKYYWHISSGTTQWERPQVSPRPKQMKKIVGEQPSSQAVDRQKVLSFPVHSMGWIELEENQVAPHNMSDTIADCISTLAGNRKDLWQTSETWGEGKDIRLLLEGDTLKLVEPRNKITLLVQPVSKMRVWGVGKEDHRDFAYVARDPNTGKHKCHMFRCHGNISGRAITTALHEMCNKILEEKKRAQEISKKNSQSKPWSDIINTPPPLSAKDGAAFNEKPYREQRKDFTATYLGSTDVPKPTGMEMLNKAINKVASKGGPRKTVLIQVTVSCIRITDCTSQEEISEDRVRFLSFMGVGRDERLCGYVMVNEPDHFICHVFQCTPNAAPLTKALEEACQLRYQKALDAHPEMASKIIASQEQESDKAKDKQANFMSSVQGLLGKLSTKKSGGKKEDVVTAPPLPKPSHTFMVKYYGALPVAVGTGIETVEEAAKHLTGGTLLICQLDVAINGVTLYDSQRSALSRRHMDADTISFCGLTSDSGHFGLIQCQGGGKYVCHVFSEYKTKAAPIVAAIHETL